MVYCTISFYFPVAIFHLFYKCITFSPGNHFGIVRFCFPSSTWRTGLRRAIISTGWSNHHGKRDQRKFCWSSRRSVFVFFRSDLHGRREGYCEYMGPLARPVNECLNIRRATAIGDVGKYGAGNRWR